MLKTELCNAKNLPESYAYATQELTGRIELSNSEEFDTWVSGQILQEDSDLDSGGKKNAEIKMVPVPEKKEGLEE